MNLTNWMPAIVALIALAGSLWQSRSGRTRHERLKRDVELLNTLPDDLESKAALRAKVDRDVASLAAPKRWRIDGDCVGWLLVGLVAAPAGVGQAGWSRLFATPPGDVGWWERMQWTYHWLSTDGIVLGWAGIAILTVKGAQLAASVLRLSERVELNRRP